MKLYTVAHRPELLTYAPKGEIFDTVLTPDHDRRDWQTHPSNAEMAAQWSVWKSGVWGLVGFQHYRRILFTGMFEPSGKITRQLRSAAHQMPLEAYFTLPKVRFLELIDEMRGYRGIDNVDMILPRPHPVVMRDQFLLHHARADWDMFARIVESEGLKSDICGFRPANLYVLKAWLFDDYMRTWERLMGRIAQERPNPSDRTYGFLAERLFNSWCHSVRTKNPGIIAVDVPHIFCPDY